VCLCARGVGVSVGVGAGVGVGVGVDVGVGVGDGTGLQGRNFVSYISQTLKSLHQLVKLARCDRCSVGSWIVLSMAMIAIKCIATIDSVSCHGASGSVALGAQYPATDSVVGSLVADACYPCGDCGRDCGSSGR
jgi:hypothetical protein